jgi:gentisate 1,2-dioxygenase
MIADRTGLMHDVSGSTYAVPERWTPIVVPRAAIDAEIERLAAAPAPPNGRRASLIVHPQSTAPGLGFAPGVDVTINVLKPGERTSPVRRNSNQVEICLRGTGTVYAGEVTFAAEQFDIWNVPAMQTYAHENTGSELFVRLSYSNAPLLEKLGAHYVDGRPPASAPAIVAAEDTLRRTQRYARETAPEFTITPEGAKLRGYEYLVDIEVIESKANHWPWKAARPHLAISGEPDARGLLLLYNPATERRNGTTHSFFATLGTHAPNVPERPVGAGHRHSSVAINFYFIGSGKSVVDGVTYEWAAGDLMLSAPSWAEHAHYFHHSAEGHAALTIQDHPFHIGTESLVWQEQMDGPVLALGSQAGVEGYVGPRDRGA